MRRTTGHRQVRARGRPVVTGLVAVLLAVLVRAEGARAAGPVGGPGGGPGGGTIGVRLMEVTESLHHDPRARQYIIDHLSPGTRIDRRVEVANHSDQPRRIAIYPGAGNVGDGAFTFEVGRTANELTTWTSTDQTVLDLRPHQTETVMVTIDVPTDASPGEHYGVIWAETASGEVDATGVRMVNRVGIRVYLDVGPGGPAPTDFALSDLVAQRLADGRPAVVTTVDNTGGRALDMVGELHLTDGPGGVRAGPFEIRLGTTVAPGESDPVAVHLNADVPEGPWTATINLRSGLVERTMSTRIRFPDQPGSQAGPVEESFLPFRGGAAGTGAAAAGIALLAVAVFLIVRTRRRRADMPTGSGRHRVWRRDGSASDETRRPVAPEELAPPPSWTNNAGAQGLPDRAAWWGGPWRRGSPEAELPEAELPEAELPEARIVGESEA